MARNRSRGARSAPRDVPRAVVDRAREDLVRLLVGEIEARFDDGLANEWIVMLGELDETLGELDHLFPAKLPLRRSATIASTA